MAEAEIQGTFDPVGIYIMRTDLPSHQASCVEDVSISTPAMTINKY